MAGLRNRAYWINMVAANIMTIVVSSLTRDNKVIDAIRLIKEKKIRQIPVVDSENRVEGVITPAALLKNVLPGYISGGDLEDVSYAAELPGFVRNIESFAEKGIDEVMEKDYIWVEPQTNTMEIAALFVNKKRPVESILVLDDQKRVLGIISPWDILKRLCSYIEKDQKAR